MTEQTRIPVPPKGENDGKSLFERANGTFDLGNGFKPAPVPKGLADVPARIKRPMQVALAPVPAQEPEIAFQASAAPPPAETVAAAAPFDAATPQPEPVAAEVAPAAPTHAELPAARFTGVRHSISREHLREQGMIEPEGAVSTLLEEFRIIKRQLLQSARDAQRRTGSAKAQRVLVSSPLPGEGKTFCSTNLALAIAAEKDSEVLLVDADFAKPSVLSVLGLPGGPGLMDALADPTIRVEDCVIGTDVPGLWVLPAGNQTIQDSEYISSNRTEQVIDRLTQGAPNRIIIFDSPPALAASPAAELAKYVAQTMLVVRADSTGQNAIEDALSLLSTCPDIKLMLNAARFSPSGRRFGSYYGYGG